MATIVVEPLVYTVREAASALRICENTLRAMIRDGQIEVVRLRDRVVIPKRNLDKILQ